MIDTIFFDVGNTLRIVVPDKEFIEKAENELMKTVRTTESHDEFFAKLEERWKAYRKLAKSTLLQTIREGGTLRQIRREFMRWVYAGGKRMRGLEVRRAWEAKRFFEL